MNTLEEARETIIKKLISDNAGVRDKYLKLFDEEVKIFADSMAEAFVRFHSFDKQTKNNKRRAYVSALICTALTLHVVSFKLLLSGYTIASGNLYRQVIESIALAELCSCRDLDVLTKFVEDKYSSKHAIRDVLRHHEKLVLNKEALEILKDYQDFYHNYSHPTRMTLAVGISLSEQGQVYVGASFDRDKIEIYRKEVKSRVSLAEVFLNFVEGVAANVAKW